jgi:hypothetical protein
MRRKLTLVVVALFCLVGEGCGVLVEKESGDAIMLSDNTQLAVNPGGGWIASGTGVTANVIQAHPDTQDRFDEEGVGLLVFRNVTAWRSNEGLPVIALESSLQNATATYDRTGYPITGLVAGPAFAATDALTITASDPADGSSRVATLDAPPPLADPATVLGPPTGLGTVVRIPDGTFDLLYVFVVANDASPGDDGLMRFVAAEDMALEAGDRVAPLLDPAAERALAERGLVPTTIYFAYFNEVESTPFFPGRAVPIQAGRMFQVAAFDLEP